VIKNMWHYSFMFSIFISGRSTKLSRNVWTTIPHIWKTVIGIAAVLHKKTGFKSTKQSVLL